MVDSIVHDKTQELINQMGPFYQSPSEEKPGNDLKCSCNLYKAASVNVVTMESIKEMFQKTLKDKNSK